MRDCYLAVSVPSRKWADQHLLHRWFYSALQVLLALLSSIARSSMLLVIPLKSIIYVYVYIKCQISILFGDHSRTGQTAACYVGWSPATIPNPCKPQQETPLPST